MGGVAVPPDTSQLALVDPLFKPNALPSGAPVSDYNSSFSAICSAIQDTVVDIAFNKLRTDHQVSLIKAISSIQTTYNGIPSYTLSPGLLQITKCTDDLNNTLNSNPKAAIEKVDSALKNLSNMQTWLKNEPSNLNSHIDAIAANQREGWIPTFTLDAADNSRISGTITQTVAVPEKKLPHNKFALHALAEVASQYQGFTNKIVNEPIATPGAHNNLTHLIRSTTKKEIETACLGSKAAITEHFKKCQLAISNAMTSILADSLNIYISHLQQSGTKQMKQYASDINNNLNTMLQYLAPSQDETQEKLVESINHLKNAINTLQDGFMEPVLREQYHALKNTVLNHLSAHAGPKLPALETIQHQLTQTSKSTEFLNYLKPGTPQVLFA
jgi:cell division protein FtsB